MAYQRRQFTTVNQMKQVIVTDEWGKLPQHLVDRNISQWCRRLQFVVQQQGRNIEHLM